MLVQQVVTGLIGFVAGMGHTSLVESLCHRFIQHASRATRDFYDRHPVLCAPLIHAWRSHAIAHHQLTYRRSQIEQHASEESRQKAERYAREHGLDPAERLGVTVNALGFVKMLIPFAPACGLAVYFLDPEFSVLFSVASLSSPSKSKWFHPEIHEDYERTCREVSWPLRLYLRSPVGKLFWVYHDMHHLKPNINFNLAGFLGDLLTGRMRWPRARDREIAFRRGGPAP